MIRICTGKMHAQRQIVSLQSQEFLIRPVFLLAFMEKSE
jgi:hypothetical protein